jgi:hypothetical protein
LSDPHEIASAIERAIAATNVGLRPVALPHHGLFSTPAVSPELYPNTKAVRGYYVPVPPPPGFKVRARSMPTLVGVSGGRQWTVEIMVMDQPGSRFAPTLQVSTYVRLLGTDLVPFPVLPWIFATAQPEAGKGPLPFAPGPFNLAGLVARAAVGQAALFLGHAPIPTSRPPIRTPVVLEAWDPRVQAYLTSSRFLEIYAGWEARAGVGSARGGSAFPVLKVVGDELKLTTGIDPTLDPNLHARTVQEVLDLVPQLERDVTGRDPEVEPIPTVTFTDPPGSVPDIRPAYRCPQCGKMEILKLELDQSTGLAHKRTLGCHVDIFPPYPSRYRDVMGAAEPVVRH